MLKKLVEFLKEVKAELKKVTWPHKEQVVNSTKIVVLITFCIIAFLWFVDTGLNKFMRIFIR
ncbi:MAG: preprotein translocase subunit SecE [bacterium]